MRLAVAVLFLFISGIAHAQSQTYLSIVPSWAADCETKSYQWVNSIVDIKKISEDSKTAVWKFRTYHSSCSEGKYLRHPIDFANMRLEFSHRGLLGGSVKGLSREIESIGNAELEVTLIVEKSRVFKKKNLVRSYMLFTPQYIAQYHWVRSGFGTERQVYRAPLTYWWDVTVALVNGETKVDLQVRRN